MRIIIKISICLLLIGIGIYLASKYFPYNLIPLFIGSIWFSRIAVYEGNVRFGFSLFKVRFGFSLFKHKNK